MRVLSYVFLKSIVWGVFVPLVLLVFLCVFFSTSLFIWHPGLHWHDQQRISQVVLILVSSLAVFFIPQPELSRRVLLLLLAFFVLGLASTWQARWPEWALKEWGRQAGLVVLAISIAGLAQRYELRRIVFVSMLCVGAVHVYLFLMIYVICFFNEDKFVSASILIHGFSNPRFFGQFQVVLFPVLSVFMLKAWRVRRLIMTFSLFVVLILQFAIAFSLGGRGVWLGVVVASVLVLFSGFRFRGFVLLQLLCGVLGFFVFLLMFEMIPYLLDVDVGLIHGSRMGLSGREVIWQAALDMAVTNPWLGVGPMHFSAVYNPIAAHPHQMVLQLVAEWGVVAGIVVVVLISWAGWCALVYLRRDSATDEDAALFAAIGGALTLAQVDGVFVMPYIETWFALLVGLAISRYSVPARALWGQRIFFMMLAVSAVTVMAMVLINDIPELLFTEGSQLENSLLMKPRFWVQGWIPSFEEASSVGE